MEGSGGLSYKLAIVGSSHLVDSEPVYDVLDAHTFLNGKPSVVISANAKTGIDLMVKKWCKRNNYKHTPFALPVDEETGTMIPYAYKARVEDMLMSCTVVIAFPMYKRSFHTHQFINQAKQKSFYPHIRAVFTHTQELPKNQKKKRARSCSPIHEVDEKERTLKFQGSCITKRKRKSPPPPPPPPPSSPSSSPVFHWNDDDEQQSAATAAAQEA